MQAYQWQCHVCTHSNAAVSDHCAICGFAAHARGDDILAQRAAREGGASLAADCVAAESDVRSTAAVILAGDVPLWRKVLGTSGLIVGGAGVLWLKLAWTMAAMGAAMLMALAGFLAVLLAASGNDAPSAPP